jgi:hypothetical protein
MLSLLVAFCLGAIVGVVFVLGVFQNGLIR